MHVPDKHGLMCWLLELYWYLWNLWLLDRSRLAVSSLCFVIAAQPILAEQQRLTCALCLDAAGPGVLVSALQGRLHHQHFLCTGSEFLLHPSPLTCHLKTPLPAAAISFLLGWWIAAQRSFSHLKYGVVNVGFLYRSKSFSPYSTFWNARQSWSKKLISAQGADTDCTTNSHLIRPRGKSAVCSDEVFSTGKTHTILLLVHSPYHVALWSILVWT